MLLLSLNLLLAFAAQSSDSTALLLNKADSLIRQNRLPAAEAAAREYIHQSPQAAPGHYMLGYILFLEKRAADSLAEYTEGAKFATPSAYDLKVVASDYVVLSDFTDADKWFSKLVEWTPNDVQAWYDLARTKYNENRFEEAIVAFKRALALDPQNVKASDNLGLSYAALGKNDLAIEAYKKAIADQERMGGSNSGPYLDYGTLLVDTDNAEAAMPLLQKALQMDAKDFRAHRELGKAYLHLNQWEAAARELQKAIELAPDNAPLHFVLAQVYRKQGLAAKAKAETDRYAALRQNSPDQH